MCLSECTNNAVNMAALSIFVPHCHGNRLVIDGVYSQYTCDHLMDSQIYIRFIDILRVHGCMDERLIGHPIAMDNGVIAQELGLLPVYNYSASASNSPQLQIRLSFEFASALHYILVTVLVPGLILLHSNDQ